MKEISSTSSMQQQISAILTAAGLDHFGFAKIQKPISFTIYESWVNEGLHGDMTYLQRHIPDKEDPTRLLAKAKSAILIAYNYRPHPHPIDLLSSLNIATYAKGEDYHFWINIKSQALIKTLKESFPKEEFLAATDSSPIMERDLAYQAGLGWIGKNTCLIDQTRGSFYFIAEILSTIDLGEFTSIAHPDRCGTCTRCIDACPTQALVAPKKLDARKCISYLTIESKTIPPIELRDKIGDHFFGCDICQDVCRFRWHSAYAYAYCYRPE